MVLGLHGADVVPSSRPGPGSARPRPIGFSELPASLPLGTCLNMATAAARGDVIAKIDDDDLYGPRYLDEAVGRLRPARAT